MITTKSLLNHINNGLFNANKEKIKHVSRRSSGSKRDEKPRIYLHIHTSRRDLFVKYSPKEKKGIFEHEYSALQEVQDNSGFEVPQPIGLFKSGILLSKVYGNPLELLLKKHGLSARNLKILEIVLNRIALFHSSNTQSTPKLSLTQIYKKIVGKKQLPADIKLVLKKAHFGFTHGDLDPFNILVGNAGSKLRFSLIDWEDFQTVGIQELDVLHFIAMTGLIMKSGHGFAGNNKKLYHIIFGNYNGNPYLGLLNLYCQKRQISMNDVLQLMPVYCDTQDYRLIKTGRDTNKFLYSDFKREYYETK